MNTSDEIHMLRTFDPSATLAGIDTTVGNPTPDSSLKTLDAIPTASANEPFYYKSSTNTVYVTQEGAVLSGYDFGTATVAVLASNVTIENCNFTGTTGYWAVTSWNNADNLTVTRNTFTGDPTSWMGAWIGTAARVTVTDNAFLNTPCDGVDVTGGGEISDNYFAGAGNDHGGHADAIWITNSTKPMTIRDNFIDWRLNPEATVASLNNTVRITAEEGPVANLTVTGNALLGGTTSLQAIGNASQLSNVSISDNDIGFASAFAFYPGAHPGVSETGNRVVDWTNPSWTADAWSAYRDAGLPTADVRVSTDGSTLDAGPESGPTTLYADGRNTLMRGGAHATNFVSGYAAQNMWAGQGANVFTYLTAGASTPSDPDHITNFDPAKDVIDVSRVDGDPAGTGSKAFAFIGTDAFDGAGPEIRVEHRAGTTEVQAAFAGDTTPDMAIDIAGDVTLTAANFALTPDASQAAMANGAALGVSVAATWPLTEYQYENVQGRAYSSYASFQAGSYRVADVLDLGATRDEIDLFGPAAAGSLTIARADGNASISAGGRTESVAFRPDETIEAGGAAAPTTFAFGAGAGTVTIHGFAASGPNADTLALSGADFGGGEAGKLASVLASLSGGAGDATFRDGKGDTVTLAGVSADTIAANPGLVRFT